MSNSKDTYLVIAKSTSQSLARHEVNVTLGSEVVVRQELHILCPSEGGLKATSRSSGQADKEMTGAIEKNSTIKNKETMILPRKMVVLMFFEVFLYDWSNSSKR